MPGEVDRLPSAGPKRSGCALPRAPTAVAGRGRVRVPAAVRRLRRGAERLQPLQGEGEVRPPLVARDGMDLVDDDRPRPGEGVPAGLARQEDVERFGGGDEDVGRLPGHRLARGGRSVAGAHHRPDRDRGLAQVLRPLRDPAKGRLEVALDVVGEGLEGRHVDDPNRVVEESAPRLLGKLVDDREERGEGLAGAGGGGDEGVSAGPHLGPRPSPGRRWGRRTRPRTRRERRGGGAHEAASPHRTPRPIPGPIGERVRPPGSAGNPARAVCRSPCKGPRGQDVRAPGKSCSPGARATEEGLIPTELRAQVR